MWVDYVVEQIEVIYGKWHPVFLDAIIQSNGTFIGTRGSTTSTPTNHRVQSWHDRATWLIRWGSWAQTTIDADQNARIETTLHSLGGIKPCTITKLSSKNNSREVVEFADFSLSAALHTRECQILTIDRMMAANAVLNEESLQYSTGEHLYVWNHHNNLITISPIPSKLEQSNTTASPGMLCPFPRAVRWNGLMDPAQNLLARPALVLELPGYEREVKFKCYERHIALWCEFCTDEVGTSLPLKMWQLQIWDWQHLTMLHLQIQAQSIFSDIDETIAVTPISWNDWGSGHVWVLEQKAQLEYNLAIKDDGPIVHCWRISQWTLQGPSQEHNTSKFSRLSRDLIFLSKDHNVGNCSSSDDSHHYFLRDTLYSKLQQALERCWDLQAIKLGYALFLLPKRKN
ncbi:uncharacterized protein F5891DRAFT_987243 [Suillus fuscotomentosus]|uniref:Uncharacterized protein n=1 Tax=Suillus fuscotomentosus TaxID=1912939 RepID=A0AAD4HE11_9AGAM|nr:uncharacterized protein F5891DRAFT_987243 [Suillus fuscotomentosus]KAG1889749.1 hypothetical protein F5891DRAFT_987243 [Suillus fuscotomentosus]